MGAAQQQPGAAGQMQATLDAMDGFLAAVLGDDYDEGMQGYDCGSLLDVTNLLTAFWEGCAGQQQAVADACAAMQQAARASRTAAAPALQPDDAGTAAAAPIALPIALPMNRAQRRALARAARAGE